MDRRLAQVKSNAAEGFVGKACVLPGITAFESPDAVEVVTILAASPGAFSIPNLEQISP